VRCMQAAGDSFHVAAMLRRSDRSRRGKRPMWKTTASSLRPLVSVLAASLAWCTAPSIAGDRDGGKDEGRPIPCAELLNLKVAQTTIASAEIVPAASGLPEYCRHHYSKDR